MSLFEFHSGFEATHKETQSVMDCPFCGRPNKFHFKGELWDCKSAACNSSGNQYGFIRKLYENCTQNLGRLSAERGLPNKQLIDAGWRFNPINRSYVCPVYKLGEMINLYKYNIDGKCLSSPGMTTSLQNIEETYNDEIWIVEGQWDYVAGRCIVGASRPISVVSLPGAMTFKDSWVPLFYNKNVRILLDNDEAGQNGTKKILDIFAESSKKPAEVTILQWPDSYRKGYDLRDLYREAERASYSTLTKYFVKPEVENIAKVENKQIEADLTCTDFSQVEEVFKQAYHTTEDMVDALILTLASVYSNKLSGEQLWFRLIGPPGAGKTTIVNAVSASEQTLIKSTFTGLFSGFRDNDDSDASLIPLIQGKTLIVKDADALLQQPNVAKIFSELRDFYDKSSSTFYKNRANFNYENIRSTFILCGTQALRRADNSFLGERFLQFELRFSDQDKQMILDKRAERAVLEAMSEIDLPIETTIKARIKGYIQHMLSRLPSVKPSPRVNTAIRECCELVALMRTQLERDNQGDLLYAASPEVPTRLLGQMTKVAVCVPVVINQDNEEVVLRILQKIALSTLDPESKRYQIVQYILERQKCVANDIYCAFDFSKTTINRELQDLLVLRILQRVKSTSDTAGRKPFTFALTPKVETLLKGVLNAYRLL